MVVGIVRYDWYFTSLITLCLIINVFTTPKNVVHIARLFVSKYKQGLGHFPMAYRVNWVKFTAASCDGHSS